MSNENSRLENIDLAVSYFAVAEKFLNLSHLASMELVKNNNTHWVISNKPISHNEYYEKTK